MSICDINSQSLKGRNQNSKEQNCRNPKEIKTKKASFIKK